MLNLKVLGIQLNDHLVFEQLGAVLLKRPSRKKKKDNNKDRKHKICILML